MKTKKTLRIVLAAAMTLTMLSSAIGFQILAGEEPTTNAKNLLIANKTEEAPADGRAGSFTYENGELKLTATGSAGFGVGIILGETFRPEDLPNLLIDVKSTAHFNMSFGVTVNDSSTRWPSLSQDFYPEFGQGAAGAIPAGEYVTKSGFLGFYTYNDLLPADGNSTIVRVGIALSEPGELTVSALQFSDVDTIYDFNAGTGTTTEPTDPTDTDDTTTTTASDDATTTTAGTTTTAAGTTAASTSTTKSVKTGEGSLAVGAFVMLAVAGGALVLAQKSKKTR